VIGTSVEADIELYVKSDNVKNSILQMGEDAKRFFQVSRVIVLDEKKLGMSDYENSSIIVKKSNGTKCVRCWNYSDAVGSDKNHPELCPRCADIVSKSSTQE